MVGVKIYIDVGIAIDCERINYHLFYLNKVNMSGIRLSCAITIDHSSGC